MSAIDVNPDQRRRERDGLPALKEAAKGRKVAA